MPVNPVAREVKQAKFISALVDSGGNAKAAYKATVPQITDGSAGVGGSRMLQQVNADDTKAIMQRIGCTKEAVISGIWKRIEGTKKVGDYVRGADVICKVGGYYESKSTLKDAMDAGLDLVEIIKVRLRKSNDVKTLQQPIDILSTSTDDLVTKPVSDGSATERQNK